MSERKPTPMHTPNAYLKKQQERVEWVIAGMDDDQLTLKEASFIESVEKQSADGRYLSEAQMDWLESIYQRKGR